MEQSNFQFLKGVNDILYRLALAAERNYPDDPNTTMVKLRMFGEASAKHIAKLLCIEIPDKQNELLRELARIPWVDDSIISVFHKLRKLGNIAVHDYHDDLGDAENCLRLSFRLAIWYYRLVKRDAEFTAPVFIIPKSQQGTELQQEVVSLKEELQHALSIKTETKEELASKENQLVALQGYIAILEGKQEETEEQTKARIAALEAQLKKRDEELAKKTERQRKEYKKEITERASKRSLELSEKETRYLIDDQLRQAGWEADTQKMTFAKGSRPEVGKNRAIAEWPTADGGWADYVLFVGLKPVGIVEAKKKNKDVCGKLHQAEHYSIHFDHIFLKSTLLDEASEEEIKKVITEQFAQENETWADSSGKRFFQIPFIYSTNGRPYHRQLLTKSGIWFRDVRKTTNLSKALPVWHQPDELLSKLKNDPEKAQEWLKSHTMDRLGLRYYQEEAILAVEEAIEKGQQAMLLAMATGTGKTRTAIAMMYRLIQSGRFNRILFLVDRTALGNQAINSFDDTRINDEPFNSIFDIKELTDRFPDDSTAIHVATVQSLVKRTLFSDEFMPTERYDAIIVDEAHRGYILDKEQTEGEQVFRNQKDYISSYRRILDHFDAIKIGLTATPALHTLDIFGKPVYRYSYRKAVIDGYLSDQEPPFKIVTELSDNGLQFAKGEEVQRITKQGVLIADELEDEQNFEVADFNRKVIAPGFNKAVCEELVNHIDPTSPQKTLVFCVKNTHADMVVEELRTAFKQKYPDLEQDAILKITGESEDNPKRLQSLITRFDKERLPNIVVTVDLLTTGVDVPSICNLVFLRKVKSRILYEQMKGRATRLCPAVGKTSFKIFDAVNLYDTLEPVDTMKPVVIRPKVSLKDLVNEITDSETYEVKETDGRSFAEHSHEQLISKVQRIIGHAQFNRDKSAEVDKTIKRFDDILSEIAGCDFNSFARVLKEKGPRMAAEIFQKDPGMVDRLENLKELINELREEPIFTDIPDKVIDVRREYGLFDNAEDFLDAFDNLVEENKNKHAALKTVVNRPRDLTRKGLLDLVEWFDKQYFDESSLKAAWKKKTNQDIAARLIGHIRQAAVGDALKPFEKRVDHALAKIKGENNWNPVQEEWLDRLAKTLKESVVIDDDTFKIGNYRRKGGKRRIDKAFDDKLSDILDKFSNYMWDELA